MGMFSGGGYEGMLAERSVGRAGSGANIESRYSYSKKARAIIADRMQWYVMNLIMELARLTPVKTGHAAYSWKFYQHPDHKDDVDFSYSVSPESVLRNSQRRINNWDGIKVGYIVNTATVDNKGAVAPGWKENAGGGQSAKIAWGSEYIEDINAYAGRRKRFIEQAILNCEAVKGGRR